MDIRHLRYFVVLAQTLHFRNAAIRLNTTQPALSQSIAAFESELDVRLFERNRQGVQLTEAGKSFYRDVQRIVFDLDNAVKKAREVYSGKLATLNVAGWTGLLLTHFPHILAAFRAQYPEVAVNITSTASTRGLEALRRHEIDLAIVREIPGPNAGDLHVELLWEHPFVVALPASHPAATADTVSLKALSGERLITFGRDTQVHGQVMELCADVKFVASSLEETHDLESMVALVACGNSLAIVPAPLQGMTVGGVIYKPIAEAPAQRMRTSAYWRKTSPAQMIERFLAIARQL